MYFGSVRFFKRLILSVISIFFLALLAFSITFGILYFKQRSKTTEAISKYNAAISLDTLNIPETAGFDKIYDILKERGYSATDIVNILIQVDPNAVGEINEIVNPVNTANNPSSEPSSEPSTPSNIAYENSYPNLYVDPPKEFITTNNTIYFTFDDGPSSKNTPDILSILKKHNIKATFFVSNVHSEGGKTMLKRIADGGHTIGIHSTSHEYDAVYSDVQSYLDDFYTTWEAVYLTTGIQANIFRFPGGSINNHNKAIYDQLVAETTRRGFVYYDWNVGGDDAINGANWTSIYKGVLNAANGLDRAIVLLHDAADKNQTVLVLEDLVIEFKRRGYKFDKLTNTVQPIQFGNQEINEETK